MIPVASHFRLTLRRLLMLGGVAFAGFVVWLGSSVFQEYRTQQHVAAELRSRDLWFRGEEGALNRWLREHVGITRPLLPSGTITRIEDDWVMSRKTHRVFTDADVPWLTSFHTLKELDVHRSKLSDEAIQQILQAHPNLQTLCIGDSCTPTILKVIGKLEKLERLTIAGPWNYSHLDGAPWFTGGVEKWKMTHYPHSIYMYNSPENFPPRLPDYLNTSKFRRSGESQSEGAATAQRLGKEFHDTSQFLTSQDSQLSLREIGD